MLSPDGAEPVPCARHPDETPPGSRFAVWCEADNRVHGVFASWDSAMEYRARCPKPTGTQIRMVPPLCAERFFANPLKLLRTLEFEALPYPSDETPYVDSIERWLWSNTRIRQNLVDYLNAVGDGDGPAIDVLDELAIARRALKFAARRLQAGILE